MRKRLQKKLYAGPFKTYGFKVIGAFKPETSPETFIDELVAFLDEHLIECAIGTGLCGCFIPEQWRPQWHLLDSG